MAILPIHLILIFRILHSTLQFHLSRWKCLTSMVYFFVIGTGFEPATACTDQFRKLGRSSTYALPDHIIKNTHRMLRPPCHTMLPCPNNFDPVKLIGISEPITHHILILFVVVLTLFTILELLQVSTKPHVYCLLRSHEPSSLFDNSNLGISSLVSTHL